MTKTIALVLALVASCPALAQTSDDVVVMRRTVAPPNRIATPPAGTPTPTPAPLPGTWHVGDAVLTPGCSATQPTLATVTCRDAGGAVVEDSRCTGVRPSANGTMPDYSACSYTWVTDPWSPYSSGCSASATRTRNVSCLRSDPEGTPVDPSKCDPDSPDAKTMDGPRANYAGCGFTPTYSTSFGACVDGFKSAPITKCTREDGLVVANSECGADKQVTKVACTNCADPVFGMASSGPRIVDLGAASTALQAGNLCRAYVTANPGVSGICILDSNNNKASINSGSYIGTGGNYWGSTCSR